MFKQEDERVHIKSFSSLIRREALIAKEQMLRIHIWSKQFHKGNFVNIDHYEQEILEVLKHLENIKVYVQREEKRQLEHFKLFLHHFFSVHILEKIPHSDKVKSYFKDVADHIFKNFRREMKSERRLLRDKPPRFTFWKQMKSFSSLDRQVARDAVKELKLTKEVKELMETIFHESRAIVAGTKAVPPNFQKDIHNLTQLVVKEFDLLEEEFIDSEIQESDILQELDELSHKNSAHHDKLKEIRNKIHHKLRTDIRVERRELRAAKELREIVSQEMKKGA